MTPRGFWLFFLTLTLCGLAGNSVWAETDVSSLTLNLRSGLDSTEKRAPAFGEFRISLDSQILDYDSMADSGRFRFSNSAPEDDLVLRSKVPESAEFFGRDEARLAANHLRRNEQRELGSTLTLTATYFADEFGRTTGVPNALGAQSRLGRWAVYGEIGSKNPTRSQVVLKNPGPTSLIKPRAMMNRTPGDGSKTITSEPTLSKIPSPEENEVPNLNNYYLEATYNFRPSLKGKVSYKRSQLDPVEPNEDLAVEGIVETGKDTMIKAGYRNQTTPENHEGSKPSNDKKVWTEFILKF